MKVYPEYKEGGALWLGEIPSHWIKRPLRSLLSRYSKKGCPELQLLSVVREQGVIVRNTESKEENHNFIPDDLSKYKVVRLNQFVINKMKAWQGSYGVSSYEGIVSPAYFVYDLDIADVLPPFFHTALRSRAYIPFFSKYSDGVRIGQWDLDEAQMKKIPFYCPPIEEQQAIVSYLDKKCSEIDALVAKRQQIIEKLRELRQVTIAQAVTKGLNPSAPMKDSGISWIGKVPEHWEILNVKHIIKDYKSGPFGSSLITSELDEKGEVLVYTPEHIAKQTAIVEGNLYLPKRRLLEMSQFVVNKGDIIFPIVGSLGRAMEIKEDMPFGIINQRLAKFKIAAQISTSYFMWIFAKSSFYDAFIKIKRRGAIISNLTKAIIKSMPILLPPLDEQIQISYYLDKKCAEIDELVARQEQIIEKLKELKTSTIAHVVTGKVDVRESI